MEVLQQAEDFRQECDVLRAVLHGKPDALWYQPTQFKDWTFNDVIGHLHLFDHAARLTLEGPELVRSFFAEIARGRAGGDSLITYTRRWLGGAQGAELLERWQGLYEALADEYAGQDPGRRVVWGGPDMSVRSCISARQMETWAHGQAIFDCLGVVRTESDRLKNIAIMGINTFGWTFANRRLEIPTVRPYVRLASPSGAVWEWGSPDQTDYIDGAAVDFCRVVTQTRNVADTALCVAGPVAQRWMAIAQCFAGPAEDPPPPKTRFLQ